MSIITKIEAELEKSVVPEVQLLVKELKKILARIEALEKKAVK